MDIHRCRFVPYVPSSINALAFTNSHLFPDQKASEPRLAVGRANGDIEIWNPSHKGSWLQEIIIRGGEGRSIDGLVWTQDPNEEVGGKTIVGRSRLFSIGYTTTITEWDLEKGRPLRSASGNHGEIWCLAAQPYSRREKKDINVMPEGESQQLVVGCTDGALVLYDTKDGELVFKRKLVGSTSKKAKVITVVFQDRNRVVAGYSDSTIRIFDIAKGTMIRAMSLGAGPKGGPKETIVWSIKILPNGNIVSGDSGGEVRIWDGKTYTLVQRIKGHREDVLSLATNFDGSIIFSGGMDRRTVIYKQTAKKSSRWAEVAHRRYHTHDVKTMATLEVPGISVVVSGGPDASPTVLPLKQFGQEHQRALSFLPQENIIQSASGNRHMMAWWDREVHIWHLNDLASKAKTPDSEELPTVDRKLVCKILLAKGEANISSASLSPQGNLLAVATSAEIKVFQLRKHQERVRVSKLVLPAAFSAGARLVQFSPDGRWLCIIREDSSVQLARVDTSDTLSILDAISIQRIDRKIEKQITLGGLGSYTRTITQIAFSSDSRTLVVGDLAGYIDTFVLSGTLDLLAPSFVAPDIDDSASSSEDEGDSEQRPTLVYGQHWALSPSASSIPKLPSPAIVLSFRPSLPLLPTVGATPSATRSTPNPLSTLLPGGEDRLLVITSSHDIFEFATTNGSLTPWSRRNPTTHFPEEFRKVNDLCKGAVWDVAKEKERVWFWGANWMFMFDLSRDFPTPTSSSLEVEDAETPGSKRKRVRDGKGTGAGGLMGDEEQSGSGIGRKVRKVVHEEFDMEEELRALKAEAMEIDEDDSSALTSLRRDTSVARTPSTPAKDDQEETVDVNWWNTYKYRPILGVAVISREKAAREEEKGEGEGEEEEDEDEDEDADETTSRAKKETQDANANANTPDLEIAIVERPLWDIELPPRVYGDQEWTKEDVRL